MGGPTITKELCDGCGLCVEACSRGGLMQIDGSIEFLQSADCDYCAECEAICPNGAISFAYDIVMDSPT